VRGAKIRTKLFSHEDLSKAVR